MRAVAAFTLMLLISLHTCVAYSFEHHPNLIVPSERIGSARLGMTRSTIEAINRTSPCPVVATYDASGHAASVETNWGGECFVTNEIQVGFPFGPALRAFGKPDRIAPDARYPHATAVWVVYQDRGIAFRVIGWDSGTTIQAIVVFPELAARASGQSRTTRAGQSARSHGAATAPGQSTDDVR